GRRRAARRRPARRRGPARRADGPRGPPASGGHRRRGSPLRRRRPSPGREGTRSSGASRVLPRPAELGDEPRLIGPEGVREIDHGQGGAAEGRDVETESLAALPHGDRRGAAADPRDVADESARGAVEEGERTGRGQHHEIARLTGGRPPAPPRPPAPAPRPPPGGGGGGGARSITAAAMGRPGAGLRAMGAKAGRSPVGGGRSGQPASGGNSTPSGTMQPSEGSSGMRETSTMARASGLRCAR